MCAVIVITSGLSLVLFPRETLAAIYKCDDNGKITYSGTKCAENAQVLSVPSDQPVNEHKSLALHLNDNRYYSAQGTINDLPATFIVDTGASVTTVSRRIAEAAGIGSCAETGHTETANGVTQSCMVTVPKLSFGTFHLNNVTVNVLPSLKFDGLLGMNILRLMKMQQQEGVMYLSN